MEKLARSQREETKMIKELEIETYNERLKNLGKPYLVFRKLDQNHDRFQILEILSEKGGEKVFSFVIKGKTKQWA